MSEIQASCRAQHTRFRDSCHHCAWDSLDICETLLHKIQRSSSRSDKQKPDVRDVYPVATWLRVMCQSECCRIVEVNEMIQNLSPLLFLLRSFHGALTIALFSMSCPLFKTQIYSSTHCNTFSFCVNLFQHILHYIVIQTIITRNTFSLSIVRFISQLQHITLQSKLIVHHERQHH